MTVSLVKNGPSILVNQKNLNSILSRWGLGQECFSLLSYNVMIGKDQEASHYPVKEEKMKIRLSKEEDLKAIMEILSLIHIYTLFQQ